MSDERDITIIGKNNCEFCRSAKDRVSEMAENNSNIHWRFVDIESDEGDKILDEEGYRHNSKMEIPIIKDCKIEKDTGKKKCRTIEGWSDEDWLDSQLSGIDL